MPKARQKSAQKRGITGTSKYFEEFERFAKRVRRKIARLRSDSGLTQEQMQDFELNLRQFQRIEGGETKNITLTNLFKIAKALGIKPTQLIDV